MLFDFDILNNYVISRELVAGSGGIDLIFLPSGWLIYLNPSLPGLLIGGGGGVGIGIFLLNNSLLHYFIKR